MRSLVVLYVSELAAIEDEDEKEAYVPPTSATPPPTIPATKGDADSELPDPDPVDCKHQTRPEYFQMKSSIERHTYRRIGSPRIRDAPRALLSSHDNTSTSAHASHKTSSSGSRTLCKHIESWWLVSI